MWLLSLHEDILSAAKGALRAPMPSLVVEARVKLGDSVKKGHALVILESIKMKTVLRAEEEGRKLVELEFERRPGFRWFCYIIVIKYKIEL
jgi:biotin carboxyl carrier protein